jgi:hypothetical protein
MLRQIWATNCAKTVKNDCDDFQCSGDPVQCALLRNQKSAQCSIPTAENVESELKSLGLKTADEINPNHQIKKDDNTLAGLANFQTFDSGMVCFITDATIPFHNTTITVPLSSICQYIEQIRTLIIAIFYIYSALIVYRSLTREV